jgi:hypothetical protein
MATRRSINFGPLTLPDLLGPSNGISQVSPSSSSHTVGGSTTGGGGTADAAGNGAEGPACLDVAGMILNDPRPLTLPIGLYTNSLLFATWVRGGMVERANHHVAYTLLPHAPLTFTPIYTNFEAGLGTPKVGLLNRAPFSGPAFESHNAVLKIGPWAFHTPT